MTTNSKEWEDKMNAVIETLEERVREQQEEFDDSLLNGDNDEQQEEQEY